MIIVIIILMLMMMLMTDHDVHYNDNVYDFDDYDDDYDDCDFTIIPVFLSSIDAIIVDIVEECVVPAVLAFVVQFLEIRSKFVYARNVLKPSTAVIQGKFIH